jgi:3D-(3,5/4)-trihydroxycyclohexane-1,2-dione acylhydrolase (decyclizing)
MGYELAGGWGARIAQSEKEPDADTIVFTGDGSYMLMNSDIYSSVLSQKKMIVFVLDNGGFAVINKLQNNTGNESFNNLLADAPTIPEAFSVDYVAHAASMGANAVFADTPEQLTQAFKAAKASDKTSVIVMNVDAYDGWTTEGHTWWEVGTPHVTDNPKVRAAHIEWEESRSKQRKGV